MHRYLLFDSGCMVCSGLAQTVVHESDGWLEARTLHEPDIQALMDQARPGWLWEPTLLEVKGDQRHAYTGAAMRAKMVVGLGPRRALRIARLVRRVLAGQKQTLTAIQAPDPTRRRLLKGAGALAASAALGGFTLLPTGAQAVAAATDSVSTALSPNDPAIAQLKASATVQAASQHFGVPDWDHVYRVTTSGQSGYHLKLPGKTALSINDPAGAHGAQHVVSQVTNVDNGKKEFTVTYTSATKQALGTVTYDQNGKALHSTTNANPPPPTQIGDPKCFITCLFQSGALGVTGGLCGRAAILCVFAPGPEDPVCDFAVFCFLGNGTFCLIKCAVTPAPTPTPPPGPGGTLVGAYAGDNVNGTLTLAPGHTSGTLTAKFVNKGTLTWRGDVYLANYSPGHPALPYPTPWCNSGDAHYAACTAAATAGPPSPTLVKIRQDCPPGATCYFDYTLVAPQNYATDTVLTWRVGWEDAQHTFHWMDSPDHSVQVEQYKVVPPSSGGGGLSVKFDHDTYNGGSLTSFTLAPGATSGKIVAYFRNTSPSNTLYQNNIFLAAYNYNGDKAGPSSLCDPDWTHAWSRGNSCDPTYITLDNPCPPGALCSFTYELRAPNSFSGTTRQNWRVLETHPDGSFAGWLNGPDGSLQTEYYDVVSAQVGNG